MKLIKRMVTVLLIAALLTGALSVALASSIRFKTTAKCYMRSQPDKGSKKLATLKKGTTFYGSDWEKDIRGVKWWYGKANGKKGWVSQKNLRADEGKKEKKYKDYKTNATFTTTAKCYLRTAPALISDIIATLKKGTTFKSTKYRLDDRGVKWYYGKYNGKSGWVSSKNLKKVTAKKKQPVVTAKPVDYSKFTAAEYYVTVTGKTINLRKEASTNSAKQAVYTEGDVLFALRGNGEWYEVLDEKANRVGYISAKYVEKSAEEVVAAPESNAFANLAELAGVVEGVKLIDAPEGSTNVTYSVETIDEQDVAEITFVNEGIAFMLRCAPYAAGEEVADIDSDVSRLEAYDITAEPVTEVNEDGTASVVRWIDSENTTQYSLIGPAYEEGRLTLDMMQKLTAK